MFEGTHIPTVVTNLAYEFRICYRDIIFGLGLCRGRFSQVNAGRGYELVSKERDPFADDAGIDAMADDNTEHGALGSRYS